MTKTRDLANLIADSKVGPSEIDTTGTYNMNALQVGGTTVIDSSRAVTATGLTLETNNASINFTGTTGNNFINVKQGLRIDIDNDNDQGATSFGITHGGGTGNVFNASENGDISFYDTSGNAKLFWDASAESLGIGTSSPSTYSGALVVADGSAGGTTHVTVTNNNVNQFVKLGVSGDLAQIGYDDGDGIAFGQFVNSTGTSFSTEHMRIDSSGNLLVGTTAATAYNNSTDVYGFNVYANGQIASSVNAAQAAYFNRQNNNGTIIDLRKDGSSVGSVGSSTSIAGNFYIAGSAAAGLQFRSDDILPTNATGSYTNGAVDLGDGGAKFRNLYLSGGVVFGDAGGSGTSTSNTLDSYEEGTWTLKIQGGTSTESFTLNYTKIGRQVYLTSAGVTNMATQTLGTGTLSVHADTSLPFTPVASTRSTSVFPLRSHNSNVATSSGFNAGVFELYNSDLHIGRLGDTNSHNNGITGSLQITAINYSAFPFELNLMYITDA